MDDPIRDRPEEPRPPAMPRGPLQGLADLSELLGEQQPRLATFLRGAVLGALVGAAIAGSTLLRRRRRGSGSR